MWDREFIVQVGCVALGGAIGSVCRFLLQGAFQTTFPWGTMAVNVIGCFIIGVLFGLSDRFQISDNVRAFAMIGILGGFTTFSSFALETRHLLADREWGWAALNILGSNAAGLAAVFAGIIVARLLIAATR